MAVMNTEKNNPNAINVVNHDTGIRIEAEAQTSQSSVERQTREDPLTVVLIAAPSWNNAITAVHPHSTSTFVDLIWGLKYSIIANPMKINSTQLVKTMNIEVPGTCPIDDIALMFQAANPSNKSENTR